MAVKSLLPTLFAISACSTAAIAHPAVGYTAVLVPKSGSYASYDKPAWPKDFVYGCPTSAYQIEGAWNEDGKGPSMWDNITHRADSPVANHDTGDQLGVQSFAFTISWTRILPNGRGPVNKKGIQFYRNLLTELHKNNIKPICTLYHWDTPQALQEEYGGFLGDKIIPDFRNYGSLLVTMNEPGIICTENIGNYYGDYPHEWQLKCGHNALRAHAAAVSVYRQKKYKGEISIILDGTYSYPLNPNSKADRAAAEKSMQYYFGWFGHPIWLGDYPAVMKKELGSLLPSFTPSELATIKGSSDFFAFDAYTAQYAMPLEDPTACSPQNTTSDYWPSCVNSTQYKHDPKTNTDIPIGPPTQSDWNFQVGRSLRDSLNWIYDNYHPPALYITENGMGVINESSIPLPEVLNDTPRVEWYKDYVGALDKAVHEDKLPVKGYVAWSCLDNFEWSDGYNTRFGITYVDFKTQRRYVKESAKWLRKTFRGW
ncbi:hypothetical protein HDV00_010391 [Rhizophlyctis rosea]|nr:hypothetical protein HDV00_010391 [Rhizophlyctis rosea]